VFHVRQPGGCRRVCGLVGCAGPSPRCLGRRFCTRNSDPPCTRDPSFGLRYPPRLRLRRIQATPEEPEGTHMGVACVPLRSFSPLLCNLVRWLFHPHKGCVPRFHVTGFHVDRTGNA
jgi:hypothetical protein